ncbi:LPXTG cell wall anchor domain-containing protein [Micromonospora sp. NPDC007271]|uniref:LPXTG cell wall anchor domain-containing protein n=1 Tax=Micromonospora sp. NPDC007271 TaxID=3154587 RepID=UPI0033D2A25A
MSARLTARLALGTVVLATGIAALPAPAAAAPDPATLAAVTERDPATGNNIKYPVKPGDVVPASLGVTNLGDAPVKGVVVQVRAFDDLDLLTTYDNCWYTVDSNLDIAWCEFDDELAAHATLAPAGDLIVTKPDARPDKVTTVVFRWASKKWADELGGVQQLAKNDGNGTEPVRGSGATLTLTPRELSLSSTPRPINFVYASLVTPTSGPTATPSPTTSATPSVSASPTAGLPSASPSAPGAAGGDGGGLPVTGSKTATMVSAGVVLLLLGGAGYLVARRRRTRFVA